jgi:hypothetical protein
MGFHEDFLLGFHEDVLLEFHVAFLLKYQEGFLLECSLESNKNGSPSQSGRRRLGMQIPKRELNLWPKGHDSMECTSRSPTRRHA